MPLSAPLVTAPCAEVLGAGEFVTCVTGAVADGVGSGSGAKAYTSPPPAAPPSSAQQRQRAAALAKVKPPFFFSFSFLPPLSRLLGT